MSSIVTLITGPKGWPVVGSLPNFLLDRIPFHINLLEEYGDQDIVSFHMLTKRFFVLNNLDFVRDIFVNQASKVIKNESKFLNSILGTEGLLLSEGDKHRDQRQLLNPAFSRHMMAKYDATLEDSAKQIDNNWVESQIVGVRELFGQHSLAVIAKVLFDVHREEAQKFHRHIENVHSFFWLMQIPFYQLIERLPLPSIRSYHKSRSEIERFILGVIGRERANSEQERDNLGAFIVKELDKQKGVNTTKTLRDQLMTLFLAGLDTTSAALTWITYVLAKHPETQEELFAEINSVLQDKRKQSFDPNSFPLMKRVVQETMRLYPPIWAIARQLTEDIHIGHHRLKKGSRIVVCQLMNHRNPKLFKEPLTFDPSRWTEERKNEIHKFAYLPFGIGARRCIGEAFAWREITATLVHLIPQWRFSLSDNKEPKLFGGVTLWPQGELFLKVEKR